MDKPAKLSLDDDAKTKEREVALLKKNCDSPILVESDTGQPKREDAGSFHMTLREGLLSDVEHITHSIRKVQEISVAAHVLWPNKKTSEKIITDAVKIINKVCKKKFSFYNGKSSKCLVGGLFYLLGFRYCDPKKQREIAVVLQITDVSIRLSYRKWLKEFPDLFQDVITKFADLERHYDC